MPASSAQPNDDDTDALVRDAEAAYAAKSIEAASRLIGQALAKRKDHARGNWLAGNLAHDAGDLDRAIASYRRALRGDPQFVEAHNDLGTAYHAKGWHREAEQCFREAARLQPGHAAALENLANALRAQGRWKDARNQFTRALVARVRGGLRRALGRRGEPARSPPANDDLEQILANAREQLRAGRDDLALQALEPAAAAHPQEARLRHLLGKVRSRMGALREAIADLEAAVELRSAVPEYRVDLGNAWVGLKEYGKALECFRISLLLDPEYAAAAANIGKVLYDLGRYDDAERTYRESLTMDPALASVRVNLAATLVSLGRYEEALPVAREALQADPRSVVARLVLARLHLDRSEAEPAFALLAEAERLEPDNAEVQRALAEYWINGPGDLAQAHRHLSRALELAPGGPKSRLLLAYVLMHLGRFEEGWKEYESRKELPERAPNYALLPYPHWDGGPLAGRRIAVVAEQGLGDEIMFASCLPELRKQAAGVALLCSRRLEALFRRSFPEVEVIGGSHTSANDPFRVPGGYDLQVAAASVPRFFRRKAADFPAHRGYLKPAPERVEAWRARLATLGAGAKVGISWRGGIPVTGKLRRSLALDDLASLLKTPGVDWVSLQYGDCRAEVDEACGRLGVRITHWQDAVDDLDETAALMAGLDLGISVCNTQIHIAGATGREVWILAPRLPDWRYGMSGERMLWYPSARVFRQEKAGDWSVPLSRVAAALSARLASGR